MKKNKKQKFWNKYGVKIVEIAVILITVAILIFTISTFKVDDSEGATTDSMIKTAQENSQSK